MSIPARLARTLHDRLGDQGGEDLVNWMMKVEGSRSDLQTMMDLYASRTDARFDALIARMDARFAASEARMDARFDAVDARFVLVLAQSDSRFATIDSRFAAADARAAERHAELLKWSFTFWCGSVGAFALLVRLLR